jgi:hypothetical protein
LQIRPQSRCCFDVLSRAAQVVDGSEVIAPLVGVDAEGVVEGIGKDIAA